MLAAALITLREGLEAALIVGIALSVLRRLGYTRRQAQPVWAGVAAAVGVSLAVGVAIQRLGIAFSGRSEELFEGITMLLAAAVLTWMIFWMQKQGRQIESSLAQDVRRAMAAHRPWALFSLAFVAVVREGIETALFLTAAAFSARGAAAGTAVLVGGALGLAAAISLGWLTFAAGRRIKVHLFFRVSGVLLLLFAAGLAAHGIHELQEAGWLPTLVEHVWDTNAILDETSPVGSLLKALFGYNGNPSLLEVLTYATYLVTVSVVGAQAQQRRGSLLTEA